MTTPTVAQHTLSQICQPVLIYKIVNIGYIRHPCRNRPFPVYDLCWSLFVSSEALLCGMHYGSVSVHGRELHQNRSLVILFVDEKQMHQISDCSLSRQIRSTLLKCAIINWVYPNNTRISNLKVLRYTEH